jgi:hypothetical protein
MIILKNKLKFYSIPLRFVKEKDDKLVLRKRVDWARAEKLGEIWRKNALDVIPSKKVNKGKISIVRKSKVKRKSPKKKIR